MLQFYGHPFSSYCQKALIALYENDTPFTFRMLSQDDPDTFAEFAALWPFRRFPVVVDEGRTIAEAGVIVEHLDIHHRGPVRFLPDDPDAALAVRTLDRVFDNYVHTPMQKIVADAMREPDRRDGQGVAEARALLDTAYAWLDETLAAREWAAGDAFTLADCAAAPALFYADWVNPIPEARRALRARRARLLARPSVARCVDEARPYRKLFPLGAPDRD